MKKWLALLLAILVLLVGYVAAGPFLTVNAIRDAVETRNTARLSRHVDFPTLRGSIKLQVDNYITSRAGADVQSSLFGAIGLRIASGMAGSAVDTMVTPAGLAAMMGGQTLWNRVTGRDLRMDPDTTPRDVLRDADYRFESPSRFTATVIDDAGEPVTFVLTRSGLSWKLSDVRLPLGSNEPVPAR
ncbi:MAG: DUF2939 domain-containing protein [Pseudomonadota bacterium]|nr:DUF2939 domain-containing protein [Pseudomonadota bacterium]